VPAVLPLPAADGPAADGPPAPPVAEIAPAAEDPAAPTPAPPPVPARAPIDGPTDAPPAPANPDPTGAVTLVPPEGPAPATPATEPGTPAVAAGPPLTVEPVDGNVWFGVTGLGLDPQAAVRSMETVKSQAPLDRLRKFIVSSVMLAETYQWPVTHPYTSVKRLPFPWLRRTGFCPQRTLRNGTSGLCSDGVEHSGSARGHTLLGAVDKCFSRAVRAEKQREMQAKTVSTTTANCRRHMGAENQRSLRP
jgi:hypothetical protein